METISKRFDAHVEFCYLWKRGDRVLIYGVSYIKHNAKGTPTVHDYCQTSHKHIFDAIFFSEAAARGVI